MTLFRPCIDLHQGQVKQIVGGSLTDKGAETNFVRDYSAAYYADLYRHNQLTGGHVIALGPNNQQQVLEALAAYPQGLQFGGGVNLQNAASYLEAGASHIIVTSYLFEQGQFSWPRLEAADVEGLQSGIDQDLVKLLGDCCTVPCTYAGGARSLDDLALVDALSSGKLDLTIGSALDIFGGQGVSLDDCIQWNRRTR